ncbi:MAG: family transcriptional regulator [Paenibacillus sp.]|nr:family transcriptional regulator [Paenibacillus sp.]
MTLEAGQPEVLRRRNRDFIMSIIENEPYVTRATLARISGLSRTTTSHIIKDFMEAGLVREKGELSSTGGRPGTRLELTADRWYSLGAELRNNQWVFVLLDLHAQVVHAMELEAGTSNARTVVHRLCEGLQLMRQKCPGKLLPAVGVGVPGLVEAGTGVIKRADAAGWLEVPIAEQVRAAVQLPAYVVNRTRAAGLAEARRGAGVGARELIYIGIGSEISAAIFVNGVLLDGANSSSGELGHVTVMPDGPLCPCGNRGCLHSFATGRAMVLEAQRLMREGQATSLGRVAEDLERLSGEALCRAAQAGDAVALACVKRAGTYLGIAVANLVNTLNPDVIIFGGPVGESGEPLLGFVQSEVKQRALSYPLAALRIGSGLLGKNAGAIGAARLVLDQKLPLIFGKD